MLARFRHENGEWDPRASVAAGASLLRHCALGRPRKGLHALSYRFQESRRLRTRARTYADWVARYATPQPADLLEFAAQGQALAVEGPLISLLVPTYQTPVRWLRKCLESVIAQAYPRWELCIADDASPDPGIKRVLEEYAARDPRIRFIVRARNGHISEASNTALVMAQGQYVALLDHDDELVPQALLRMVQRLKEQPALRMIYSDEDKIDASGLRFDPYFKPDWNPDLLLSQNYICHFTVIDADLVRDVGGFRVGFEGSQDHDLFLRCTRRLQSKEIGHLAEILYHWRAIPGSTALERGAKDYAADAGARAVQDHLDLTAGGQVESLLHGHYRVRRPLPDSPPKVALIIPTRDRVGLLKMCVESVLLKTTYPNFEIIIVDNQSTSPDALEYLSHIDGDPRIRVLPYDAPFNYSAINNYAVRVCDADVVALVNNDIEVITPDWLEEMVAHALRPTVGAVGAMLYYPGDTIQHAGVVLGVWGVANHFYAGQPKGYPGHGGRARVVQNLSAVTAACLVIQRSRFLEVGGLDEANLAVAFNDVDFCLRLMGAGYANVWTPFAELYHHESASRGAENTDAKRARFAGEVAYMTHCWAGILRQDPAYNPNLSLEGTNCELAFPPRGWDVHGAMPR
ncbi:Glycosyltransferase, GT2 family [Pseudoxanthomonas sp. GM95]|nr:Glycosyltransferase, GT2 family [Pseudoxanthomonas sp. GM95]